MNETNEPQDTRKLIFDSALELFSRKGFEGVGVQEIVDKASITKPSLYYHFKSKQGLLEAIVAEYGAELIAVTRKAAEYHRDLVMNLNALFAETMSYARSNTAFYRLAHSLFSAAAETTGYITARPLRRDLVAVLETLFANAASDHGNMKSRETVYAETFLGLLETWAILEANGEAKLDAQTQHRIVHNYMHGIFS
jgi:TetR/AcrR family transcriptional regulator